MNRTETATSVVLSELLKAAQRHAEAMADVIDRSRLLGTDAAALRNEMTVFDIDVVRPLRDVLAEMDSRHQPPTGDCTCGHTVYVHHVGPPRSACGVDSCNCRRFCAEVEP